MIQRFSLILILMTAFTVTFISPQPKAFAACDSCCQCKEATCSLTCTQVSADQSNQTITHLSQETEKTVQHVKQEFINNKQWLVEFLFQQRILPAMMLMTEQITAMAMHQVMVIGAFLDAQHQLETQQLFQELTAEAHKKYQPSEGMCTFGTSVRSLAASDRNVDLSAITLAKRAQQRELLSGDALAVNSKTSDFMSRIAQFRTVYCNKADNGRGLENLCPDAPTQMERVNKDIDYTATIDTPMTLKLDFTPEGDTDHTENLHAGTAQNASADEEDVMALSANLYAHDVAPYIAPSMLTDETGTTDPIVNPNTLKSYMNIRALAAKRSVAENSFASITAMKSQGEKEVQPYLYAIMKEMGVSDPVEIKNYLGDRPSYYAQMGVLTQKLYQNPGFYTELYDKPANVDRKEVAMQAIELMQRRDIYRSSLRTEAILSVMLETALVKQEDALRNELWRLTDSEKPITLP